MLTKTWITHSDYGLSGMWIDNQKEPNYYNDNDTNEI